MLPMKSSRIACRVLSVFLTAITFGSIANGQTLKTLIVGGGPNPQSNQVAIESNVRYMLRILPGDLWKSVLFANGDTKDENVLFESKAKDLPEAEKLLTLLMKNRQAAYPSELKYRATTIPQLDGPAKLTSVNEAFDKLQSEVTAHPSPILLYFTGHGSPNRASALENNVFDLWGGNTLSVKQLSTQIEKLPADLPLNIVMVQCYSGSFANLLFENADPKGDFTKRDIAGFFATVKEKTAAGCTPALDESEYHDFTSYFFAAMTGRDRVGRKVTGADYNRNGKITMDEAYCYTIIHDASIDIPICTSDVFLRRYMVIPDKDVFEHPYKEVLRWASRPQRAVLEELSKELKFSGDDRGKKAYSVFFNGATTDTSNEDPGVTAQKKFTSERNTLRTTLFGRFPDLRDFSSANYQATWKEAVDFVGQQNTEGNLKDFIEAEKGLDAADELAYQKQIADAKLTRFVRMYKTVTLSALLRQSGEPSIKERFEKLIAAESRELLGRVRSASAQ